MARSSSVNFESVEQICFQLLSQGENPSFNLVYAELGNKGSSEIVQRYMDQWRRETGAAFFRQRSIPGMPDELVPSVDAFMARIWSLALQSADLVFATQREELEKEQESVRARLQAADERILQMEAEAAQATAHIGALNQGVQACESTISELRSQALELHRQREALEIRIKQLEEAVDVRDQKFVTESERLTRLLQNDRDRYAASLKEEQDRSAVDRELLMRQIDQARQEKLAESPPCVSKLLTAKSVKPSSANRPRKRRPPCVKRCPALVRAKHRWLQPKAVSNACRLSSRWPAKQPTARNRLSQRLKRGPGPWRMCVWPKLPAPTGPKRHSPKLWSSSAY